MQRLTSATVLLKRAFRGSSGQLATDCSTSMSVLAPIGGGRPLTDADARPCPGDQGAQMLKFCFGRCCCGRVGLPFALHPATLSICPHRFLSGLPLHTRISTSAATSTHQAGPEVALSGDALLLLTAVARMGGPATLLAALALLPPLLGLAAGIDRPRGVDPALAPRYVPDGAGMFACLNGKQTFPAGRINDDYCDCYDGSDEPGAIGAERGCIGSNSHPGLATHPPLPPRRHLCLPQRRLLLPEPRVRAQDDQRHLCGRRRLRCAGVDG